MLAYSAKEREGLHSAKDIPAPQDSNKLTRYRKEGTNRVCQILVDVSHVRITPLKNLAM